MPKQTPSYKTGFAAPERNRNYLYPSLWVRCRGAWSASLGETGGTIKDQSGVGSHGTLANTATWARSGNSMALDFASAANAYVDAPVRDTFQGAVTIATWVNARTTGGGTAGRIVSTSGLSLGVLSGVVLRSTSDGGGTNFASSGTFSLNVWTHVAVTRSAGSNTIQWFINGNAAGTATPTVINNQNETTIGNVKGSAYSRGFDGLIDDVFLHDRALTIAEIKTLATRRGIAYERRGPSYLAQIVAALRNRRTSSRMLTFPG